MKAVYAAFTGYIVFIYIYGLNSCLSAAASNNKLFLFVKVEQISKPNVALFLIKYLMMLVVGIPSVFWVGSKKTCFEWASFFHGSRRKEWVS